MIPIKPSAILDEETANLARRPIIVSQYTRQDVLRILDLQPRQLVLWEQVQLVATREPGHFYTFTDLRQMRALRDLQSSARISVRGISASVSAMQRVSGIANPLLEAGLVLRGSRLAFRHDGALVDPLTRQLAFDFDHTPKLRLLRVESPTAVALEIQDLFHRAVRLEEDPNQRAAAIDLYHEVLTREPNHAPACINLGTIHYAQRDFATAESMYRRATVADPGYALAFFDLGNVLDELQQLPEAIEAYERAVSIVPTYADAHYNLALAYERKSERRRALRHWQIYTRLDPIGPWANHAKEQARKILSAERLTLVPRLIAG